MNALALFFGLVVVGFFIDHGLTNIAKAIQYGKRP